MEKGAIKQAVGKTRGDSSARWWALLAAAITAATALIATAPAQATPPQGDNGLIAFERVVGGGFDIFTLDPKTGAAAPLLSTAAPADEFEPAWFPNNRIITFARSDGGDADVFGLPVVPRIGTAVNLTPLSAVSDADSAVAPDGSALKFARTVSPTNNEIFTKTIAFRAPGTFVTGPERNLTNSPGDDLRPDYSPDGKEVTFSSNRSGNDDIFVMNADGSGQRPLASNPDEDRSPTYSPDGAEIAFHSTRGGGLHIWKMKEDGSGVTQLTFGPDFDSDPTYSGDGKRIIFERFITATFDLELFSIPASGGTPVNLTNNPASSDLLADQQSIQTCRGKTATIVGDDGPDKIKGTKKKDVIDANATSDGKNKVRGRGGNDRICVGPGPAKVNCGKGDHDKVIGTGKGKKKESGCEVTKGKGFK